VAMPSVRVADFPLRRMAALDRFASGYEHVLGTSLDLIVESARPAEAAACEAQLLGEIERLRRIFSTYDSNSEISRMMAGAAVESAELAELLGAYAVWGHRTEGLIAANLGAVAAAWREAARTGQMPDDAELARAASLPRALNVDALGKALIIDRAVAVARRFAPGGVVNLGGDIRAWGETIWRVEIADPQNSADNAPALAAFQLQEAAVATSGGYARYLTIGGKRLSHLIDPRTRRPLEVGGSATVVAADCVSANALATAASIGGRETGARLASAHGAHGYFFAAASGTIFSGGILAAIAPPAPGSPAAPASVPPGVPAPTASTTAAAATATEEKPKPETAAEAAWPETFQVDIGVVLKKHAGNAYRIHRPYVAVWVKNAKGYIVRTVAAWGEDNRYQRRLSSWWNNPREGKEEPRLVARATRAPGAYTVVWDGKDDFGRRVPAGDYTIAVEICREDGHHVVESVALTCGSEPVKATLRETAESDASVVGYGPRNPEAKPAAPAK
jgi:FAD:protein FMN transferase